MLLPSLTRYLLGFATVVLAAGVFLVAPDAQAGVIVQRPLFIRLEKGLVGYWSFEGKTVAGTHVYDASGNGNRGTLTPTDGTGPVRAAGKIGQGLQFDGVNDYVLISNASGVNFPAGNNFSFLAWIKIRQCQENGSKFVDKRTGIGDNFIRLQCYLDDDRVYFSVVDNTGVTADPMSTTKINTNQWRHVVGVKEGNNVYIYVDGVREGTATASFAGSWSSQDVRIGYAGEGGTGRFADGLIDDVRVYNRALSANDIKRLYKIGATAKIGITLDGPQSGLVGWWTFDGPALALGRAPDESGNGKEGRLTGAQRATGKLGQGVQFDGTDDYVSVGNAGSGIKTISFWVKANIVAAVPPQTETRTNTYNQAGTFTWNASTTASTVTVEAWGGGGGGGGGGSNADGGGGGAGGGYAKVNTVSITNGQNYTVVVGSVVVGSGVVGSGGGGGAAGANPGSGGTAPSGGGDGGGGGNTNTGGSNGSAPGGGGGGGGENASGADGARGKVVITWTETIGGSDAIDDYKVIDIDGTDQIEIIDSAIVATSFPAAAIYVDGKKGTTVDGQWHHVVIVDITGVNASAMDIGRVSSSYLNGLLDDVRIYNRALNVDEIKRLYKIGATAKMNTTQTTDSLAKGMVGHWSFDGPALALGRAPDSSGNGNEGKLTPAGGTGPVRAPGKIGQGLGFDGVDDWVRVLNAVRPTQASSVSLWVKVGSALGSNQMVLSSDPDVAIGIEYTPTSKFTFDIFTANNPFSSNETSFTSAANTWHHLVWNYDGAFLRGYVDGVRGVEVAKSGNLQYSPGDLFALGTYCDVSESPVCNGFLKGALDDVRIYNRALTSDEIKRLYNMGR